MFLLLLGSLIVLWIIYDNFISKQNYPPGPFRFPIVGNIPQLSIWSKKESQPFIMLKNVSKKYGDVSYLKLGFLDQVVVDDPELMKSILQSEKWGNRPILEYVMDRSFGKPYGILWGRGESHKEMRRFAIRTLRDFGFGKQSSQEAMMEEELTELCSRLNSKLESDGNTICMQQFFNISVLNIIWSMMAGVRFSHDDEKFKKVVFLMNQTMKLLGGTGNIFMAFPFLRHILPRLSGYGAVRKEMLSSLHGTFFDILNERRDRGLYKQIQGDFIDVFLNEIDKHQNDEMKGLYTERQFVITVMDLFVAGSETTANSLEFAILYMIHYPEVQRKVQEEIDRVIGKTKFPNVNDKQNMPFTDATIHEVLRLSSVVPVIVRCPHEDAFVGNYPIKKETFTILNTHSAHHDPTIWKEPYKFIPERFLDASKSRLVNTDRVIAFGLGKRVCLGEILARATLFTFFVRMLQNYSFAKSPDHPDPSLKGIPGLTLSPEPYHVVITRRFK